MASDGVRSDGRRFVDDFAIAQGWSPLSDAEVDDLLGLAADAAHASERLAAPLACFLAGRTGKAPAEIREAMTRWMSESRPSQG